MRLRFDPRQHRWTWTLPVPRPGRGQRERGARHHALCLLLMLRCFSEDAPATAGILRPLTLDTPAGSIVDALPPAAVAGGNVETSQRIVDVLLRALAQAVPERVPAASAGTMSNLTIGGVIRAPASPLPITRRRQAAWARGPASTASPACRPT